MFCAIETITAKKIYWIKKKIFSYEFLRIRKNWSFFVRIRRKFVQISQFFTNSYENWRKSQKMPILRQKKWFFFFLRILSIFAVEVRIRTKFYDFLRIRTNFLYKKVKNFSKICEFARNRTNSYEKCKN